MVRAQSRVHKLCGKGNYSSRVAFQSSETHILQIKVISDACRVDRTRIPLGNPVSKNELQKTVQLLPRPSSGNSTDSCIPLAIPRSGTRTTMALHEFCESLPTSPIIHSRIESVHLRRGTGIFYHEFLMVRLTETNGPDFWVRLERAGDTKDSNHMATISMFPPADNAHVARTEDALIWDNSDEKVKLRFSATSDVSLYALRQLLSFFVEGSTVYSLLWQNCRFFCCVVLELLSEQYPCEGAEGLRPIKEKYCRDARDRIKSKFKTWADTRELTRRWVSLP
jgi:hypothetical protein